MKSVYNDKEVCEIKDCEFFKNIQLTTRYNFRRKDYVEYSKHFRENVYEFLYGDKTAYETVFYLFVKRFMVNGIIRFNFFIGYNYTEFVNFPEKNKISLWISKNKYKFISIFIFIDLILILINIVSPFEINTVESFTHNNYQEFVKIKNIHKSKTLQTFATNSTGTKKLIAKIINYHNKTSVIEDSSYSLDNSSATCVENFTFSVTI
ncbi:hypothetical protein PIROE2DRAFT_2963 [Piromyces sp. E2]|nr:hypothetical protein PIROE2DRAFT_2963 [Piromyces sp. E2]|eukprot:OUM69254.1 hypothetical protein PIROE2DRAFT_2963 [Piromyces sp. E2]